MNNKREKHRLAKIILFQIISKGGLMAVSAAYCIYDAEKASKFIVECASQCDLPNAVNYWGEELVKKMQDFERLYSGKIK